MHENIKGLTVVPKKVVHVWVCGEDPDVSADNDKKYLANIMAITDDEDTLTSFIKEKRLDLLKFVMLLKSRRTDDLYNKQMEEATKSAKAAIMSRNMSHNIGSHVMSYLKQHLSSVKDMLSNRVLSEIIEDGSKASFEDPGKKALPFLVGLGHFISYLQERQDFIATIATDYIPYYSTVNFKDFIYDELNPDKRAERHSEWTVNLKMDNILLGNIARSEGLGRPTRPTIEFDLRTNKEKGSVLSDIVLKFGNNFNGSLPANGSDAEKDLNYMRKIQVSLPGGIVGRQAVFSIIENIIRNAAKHGDWREKGKLELTFNIYSAYDLKISKERSPIPSDDNEEGCKSLWDVLQSFYKNAKDSENLYFMTITDNCEFSLESLGKLRCALLDDYIDKKGVMRNGNKGLKEIRISSAWLRSIRDEKDGFCPYPSDVIKDRDNINPKLLELDSSWRSNENEADAPIVYTRIVAKKGKKTGKINQRNLQYIICISIPRKVAIISNTNDFEQYKELLRKNSWRVYSEEEFIKEEKNKSFEFILCDDDTIFSHIRPVATSRVFSLLNIPDIDKEKLLSSLRCATFDANKYESLLYKYLSSYNEGEFICIDDHAAKEKYENKPKRVDDSIEVFKIVVDKENVSILAKNKDGEWRNCEDKVVKQEIEQYDLAVGTYFKVGKVFVADTHCCGKYIYRKHNETVEQFNNFIQSYPHFNGFVEGITGNNSTDRIIRNEELDNLWFYRNLHAMKSHVAIFDERIFAKIMGIDETNFTKGNMQIVDDTNIIKVKEDYKKLTDNGNLKVYIDNLNADELNNSYDKLKEILFKSTLSSKGFLGTAYLHKGIYVYTLIADINNKKEAKESNKYYLIGAQILDGNVVINSENNNHECICTILAELSYSKANGLNIEFKSGSDYAKNKFDYITIHQGLLDKLYEDFGIKGSEKEKIEKTRLTTDFYKMFSKESKKDYGNLKGFLPGLIVHSGRSKPGENDMPQKLPFIQYAALEHSVLDCKYTLVELLDYSRYEE